MSINNYKKDILHGGLSNIIITIAFFLRNILLLRKISVLHELDSFFLGISLIQLFIYSIIKIFINSIQPNIANEKNKYSLLSIIIGSIILCILHLIFLIFHKEIIKIFTDNIDVTNAFQKYFIYLFILSFFQSIFIFFNGIVNILVSIKDTLRLEMFSNVLVMLFLFFCSNNIISVYNSYILNYLIVSIITLFILFKKFTFKFNYSKNWIILVFSNVKNYFFSFLIGMPTSWYEKKILSNFSTGSITIFSLVTKVISPINNILINPSVLLATFSKNNIDDNKKILESFILICLIFLTSFISVLIFVSGFSQSILNNLLLINNDYSSKIIRAFQIISLSILSSVIYTGFQKYLNSINQSKSILWINIISNFQLLIFYFLLKKYDIYGFISALVINSYLSTFYVIIYFSMKYNFNIYYIYANLKLKLKILILISISYLLLKFTFFNVLSFNYFEIIFFIIFVFLHLISIKENIKLIRK